MFLLKVWLVHYPLVKVKVSHLFSSPHPRVYQANNTVPHHRDSLHPHPKNNNNSNNHNNNSHHHPRANLTTLHSSYHSIKNC